jgi:hypothetical protein
MLLVNMYLLSREESTRGGKKDWFDYKHQLTYRYLSILIYLISARNQGNQKPFLYL